MPMCPKSPIYSRYKVFCQPFYMEYVEMKGDTVGSDMCKRHAFQSMH
jgi:hypothetical protein